MRATPKPNPKQGAVSFAQLEPSKENIQPLLRSTGKRMHSLAANLQKTPKALTEKQERERKQWEAAIKSDTSNDPLSLWLKYIKWTKLNFTCPTNQKAQLLPLIERCSTKFINDKRYKNNKKYIKLWLEYSHLSRDSMEIFKFMYANKIGYELALFWRGWAIIAEQNNNFDLVDQIFNEAKQVNAEPIKDINRSYDGFLARMKKKISSNHELQSNNNNNMNQLHEIQQTRSTLGQITENTTSHRMNHEKSRGFGKQINDGIIDNDKDLNNNKNKTFGIYCDNENNPNIINNNNDNNNNNMVNNGWIELGTECNRSKENNGMAKQWNNMGFGVNLQQTINNRNKTASGFSIPIDDEYGDNNNNNKGMIESIPTHKRRAMGSWQQQGRYLCAAFIDPNLLSYDGKECCLEEARCRVYKERWNKEMEEEEDMNNNNNMMMVDEDDDDMMMTQNVGRILYNQCNNNNNTDLSIPSTIKEEPDCTKSNISTDITRKNRKRKTSDEGLPSLIKEEPLKKRLKLSDSMNMNMNNNNNSEEHTYDVFAELTTTTNLTTNTIGSHIETPLRRLDFATPGSLLLSKQKHKLLNRNNNNNNNIEQTQDISSMTEFFRNPIKITDKRMGDTPTVTHIKQRIINPTATITYHSRAAMNDIVEIFGGNNNENDDNINNNNNDTFGIYEDTATIHTKIDIENIEIEDDIPPVDELQIGLQTIEESEDDEIMIFDPFNEDIMIKYELKILNEYINNNNNSDIFNEENNKPPVSINDLLNGETDIELDDEGDSYLNVTEYIQSMSINNKYHIFFVNDLNEDEDTERMLLIDIPSSLRSYHITQILQNNNKLKYLSMEYGLVQSVYLYSNCSFTISKITDNFQTLYDILLKIKKQKTDLNEKLSLYFITEIIRIISQIHELNIIHSNLKINSFLVKFAEISSINGDWSDEIGNGWQHFGLLLHDINKCIKLDDFININNNNNNDNFGCLINENNLNNNNNIYYLFQKLINNKSWCFEFDYFSIFIIIIQLLTQKNYEKIIEEILLNINNNNNLNNIIEKIDIYRDEIGLNKLKNKNMWNNILQMLLMRDIDNDNNKIYQFNKLSFLNRRNYLKKCYKYCCEQLIDLENLSPKLKIILARIDRMSQK